MDLVVRRHADAACAAAADFVTERLRHAVAERGTASVAFSGGGTPRRMLEELAKAELPWDAVHVFQVDERLAPDGHEDRNVTGLKEHLLAHVDLPAANFHPMPVGLPNLLDAAERYARALPPVLDVVHLGLGEDGHTASLFPGDEALEAEEDVAPTGEHDGRTRLTLTLPVLVRARHRFFLVTGAGKTEALVRLLGGDRSIPAAMVGDAVVFADERAVGAA